MADIEWSDVSEDKINIIQYFFLPFFLKNPDKIYPDNFIKEKYGRKR